MQGNISRDGFEEYKRQEEGKEELGLYKQEYFKEYLRDKYMLMESVDPAEFDPSGSTPKGMIPESYLQNEQVLKMIYALEWFDIPKSNKFDLTLIKYHPNITINDYEKVMNIENQQFMDDSIFMCVSSLIFNRLFNSSKMTSKLGFFKRRIFRYPAVLLTSSLLTVAFDRTVIKYFMQQDMK